MSPRVHKACGAAAGRPCVRPAGRPRRAAPCAMCSCRFRAQPCWRALTLLDRRWCAPNRVHTCADSRAGGPPRDGSASRARVRSSRRAAAVARPAVCTPHAPSLLGLPAVAAATRQPPARGLLWTRSVATVPWRTSPPLRGHERARAYAHNRLWWAASSLHIGGGTIYSCVEVPAASPLRRPQHGWT